MSVIVRFAPSPTGYLHIGGARTALFNWLYARHTGGKFLLRIEDTDRERSTQQAVDAIFESLKWLGLDWDNEPVFQFARAARHAEVAQQLVASGNAYYCYCSIDELNEMRQDAMAKGLPPRYNGYWRDRTDLPPKDVAPVIRLKSPQTGTTVLTDMVQGTIELENSQLDDMILLRADGTPTYMLSVVVDDHDMGITHVIRGDDHLTNMFRQYHLFKACNWEAPKFAHIPLIHGPDGAKLSKRHGALGAEQYKNAGFLPEAMRNYLLRLGWSHGNDEIISTEQAIEWFDIQDVGRSPARFDVQKLLNLNGHYIRQAPNQQLLEEVMPFLEGDKIDSLAIERINKGMNGLKDRAKTLVELANSASFYINRPNFEGIKEGMPQNSGDNTNVPHSGSTNIIPSDKENYLMLLDKFLYIFDTFVPKMDKENKISDSHSLGTPEYIDSVTRQFCKEQGIKLSNLMEPARIALTGSKVSPSLFEVMSILGLDETVLRFNAYRSFLQNIQ
ncbi:MAG: glutamate--tRNA ligase [Holosporales bacterium]|jgi:glutamyl-tRNA synthetase|nr:glutamate--tRNA ligase [Holosporales bacterium]